MMKSIKILVATHLNYPIPQSNILLPVHVGSVNSELKIDIQRDDEGENISSKNNQYCELTAIYWAWKNLKELDYIGLAHYRRYPTFEKESIRDIFINKFKYIFYRYFYNSIEPGSNFTKWHSLDNKLNYNFIKDVETSLRYYKDSYDIYVPNPIKYSNYNVRSCFNVIIPSYIIEIISKTIHKFYPEFSNEFTKLLNGNRIFPCNMFVFNSVIFSEYSKFMFTILFETEEILKLSNIKPIPRTFGYIGELLTSCFIEYKISNGSKTMFFNILNIKNI
tara:strand:+ start:2078 stop:2908 length:831 start_codon:yes stop_codon:yes gene_type:complete